MTKKQEKTEKKEEKPKKEDKDTKIAELTNLIKILQADFENYRKRKEAEQQEFVKFSSQMLIEKLMPIVDNFELALQHSKKEEEFVKGVELIFAELMQILEQEGVKPINPKPGEMFDPTQHEALLVEKTDKKEDSILEVLQKGYHLNGKVIRHAKVKVSKKT